MPVRTYERTDAHTNWTDHRCLDARLTEYRTSCECAASQLRAIDLGVRRTRTERSRTWALGHKDTRRRDRPSWVETKCLLRLRAHPYGVSEDFLKKRKKNNGRVLTSNRGFAPGSQGQPTVYPRYCACETVSFTCEYVASAVDAFRQCDSPRECQSRSV